MNERIFSLALLAGSLATISYLPAQDNQSKNTKQPTLEDRIDQLEQEDQNLKGQVDQLRNDMADLQDRIKRLEGRKEPSQGPPPAASSSERNRSSDSAKVSSQGEEQSYDVFYQKLQSGGHWFDDPTYGQVWQPDIAASDRSWRPYSDGHWAHTDRGWTWISNEDFGWATYHYGRWARRADSGWIWIPGSRWAPAWVSWRESDDHVGWAPLPPEVADDSQTGVGEWVDNYYDIGPGAYSFVKISDLSQPSYREVILPPSEDAEFFSETRNVTNVAFDGDIVAVNGPRYERIQSQAKVPSYKLNYLTENQGRFGINTRGDQLEVVAPPATLQRAASMQPKIEKTLSQTQLDHGWQEVSQQKAAQMKKAAAQQAPVPGNLPPSPTPSKPTTNVENQPPQIDREQKRSSAPGSSTTSTPLPQNRAPSSVPRTTPNPEAQPVRKESPPSQSPAPERNRQAERPAGNETNSLREKSDQNAKPSSNSELQSRAPAPEQTRSGNRAGSEHRPANDAPKEPLNEPRRQIEPGREEPANKAPDGRTLRSEPRREEPAKGQKPEESRRQPEPRGEQKQQSDLEQKGAEKKDQKREKPKKEEPE
jgi:hypothetical protein